MLTSTLAVAVALAALAGAFALLERGAPAVAAAGSSCPAGGAPPPATCPACIAAGCAGLGSLMKLSVNTCRENM